MVDAIKGLDGFRNQQRNKGGEEHPPPLIDAIMHGDIARVENLLTFSDPTVEYQSMNAYEHAKLKKIDLRLIIASLQLSIQLRELHRRAVDTARQREQQGKGPGVYSSTSEQGGFAGKALDSKGNSGPGILV